MGDNFTNWVCMVMTLCFPNIFLPGYIIVGKEVFTLCLALGQSTWKTAGILGMAVFFCSKELEDKGHALLIFCSPNAWHTVVVPKQLLKNKSIYIKQISNE